ncbi:hypothetical protein ABZ445_16310 [Streptomyces chartreusis]|uniref:hypothetical protein n=1 Tax=Streptomyces chartreusis TaxID=1969 RepID=UPI0034050CDB
MKTKALKRTLLRTHRYGMVRQADEAHRAVTRNYRSPEGRTLIAQNHVYRNMPQT